MVIKIYGPEPFRVIAHRGDEVNNIGSWKRSSGIWQPSTTWWNQRCVLFINVFDERSTLFNSGMLVHEFLL